MRKHQQKLIPLGLWLAIVGSFWIFAQQHNLTPVELVQQLSHFLAASSYGPLVFLAIFFIRPLLLFPNSVLMLLAGFLYGPLLGLVLAVVGETISAMVAYGIGLYFGVGLFRTEKKNKLSQYIDALKDNGFDAVLVMRLILLNVDLVSYSAGIFHVNWLPFLGATVLGSLAGTAAYVLAGASIEGEFIGELPEFDPWLIITAAILFASSLLLAWYVRRRRAPSQELAS